MGQWDYHFPVGYAICYTSDERRQLVDTAAATFKKVVGQDVRSVQSWKDDAITVAHFADHCGIDAFADCRSNYEEFHLTVARGGDHTDLPESGFQALQLRYLMRRREPKATRLSGFLDLTSMPVSEAIRLIERAPVAKSR